MLQYYFEVNDSKLCKKVTEGGLSRKFAVFDQDPSNRRALRMPGIASDKSYFQINQH